LLSLFLLLVACATPGVSEGGSDAAKERSHPGSVALMDVIESISDVDDQRILLAEGVSEQVMIGHWDGQALDYSTFLTVLRNNGLAAVSYDKRISVVHVSTVRNYPLPTVKDGGQYHADEWVNRVVKLESGRPETLVPLLRPLASHEGVVSADSTSGSLIIVDRFANTERIAELARSMNQ